MIDNLIIADRFYLKVITINKLIAIMKGNAKHISYEIITQITSFDVIIDV